jgi:hypothetical protein
MIRGLVVRKMSRLSSPEPDEEFWRWLEAAYVWPDDDDDTPTPTTTA